MGKGHVGKKTANKMFIDEQVTTVSSWSSSLLRALSETVQNLPSNDAPRWERNQGAHLLTLITH